ncbi:MAG: twin-arginine translocation signal domain-containing protein [Actinomycetota bacterium]|nr:twin-arginine translocation signal domain-containing protein [Rubrobacter sp.]MDQ3507312.1 twin-arginine translocation signal domain-containing protein [Actinomycetota bacterium]
MGRTERTSRRTFLYGSAALAAMLFIFLVAHPAQARTLE